jgi:hypothetical protein
MTRLQVCRFLGPTARTNAAIGRSVWAAAQSVESLLGWLLGCLFLRGVAALTRPASQGPAALSLTAWTAFMISWITSSGWVISDRWPASISTVVASIRPAMNR